MKSAPRRSTGFSLVEVLVSMVILTVILLITFSMTSNVASLLKQTRARIDTFQEARVGFEAMNRRISQAMLNTYWDYEYQSGLPKRYSRQSELHFVSGPTKFAQGAVPPLLPDPNIQTATHGIFFQAPTGFSTPSTTTTSNKTHLNNLLNVTGYYTDYASDKENRPTFLTPKIIPEHYQFRLLEMSVPTEKMETYQAIATPGNPFGWFQNPARDNKTYQGTRVLAENILALVIYPQASPLDRPAAGQPKELAPAYYYDSRAYLSSSAAADVTSRNQLPPMVQVTMVAIDKVSAERLLASEPSPQTLPVSLGLNKLFLSPTPSGSNDLGATFRSDLKSLEKTLLDKKLNARIYSTTVSILQAKWSEN